MGLPSKTEAQAFFAELEKSSSAARDEAVGTPAVCPWGDPSWPTPAGPTGIVLHYTAGNSFRGSVDWLCRPSYNTKAGAHVVIARGREPWADKHVTEGGLVGSLATSVVQIRLPSQTAWHSTWANEWALGVELASCGEIRKNAQGVWVGPNGDWSERVSDTSTIYAAGDRTWHGYTDAQLRTAIRVLRYYCALYPNIYFENVVGHENIQSIRTPERMGHDKRDFGVATDLQGLREAVFLDRPWRSTGRRVIELDACAESIYGELMRNKSATREVMETNIKDALIELGYNVRGAPVGTRHFGPTMIANRRSLYMAQKMLGLVPDMVVGPKTVAAVAWRLKDRWGLA